VPAAIKLNAYLNRKGIPVHAIEHPEADTPLEAAVAAGIQDAILVSVTFLADRQGLVIAAHPQGTKVDLAAVGKLLGRDLQQLPQEHPGRIFPDCERGFEPPIGGAYGVSTVVETALLAARNVMIPGGSKGLLLRLDGHSFRQAMAGAARGSFSVNGQGEGLTSLGNGPGLDDVARRLQRLYRLPPMPAVALKLLQLTADPDASARQLAVLIERDPSLAAQVMRYARSALFQYQGEVSTVQDAITRVLGFERVAHVAMSVAASRAFNVQRKGMLGLDAFWRHGIYCAFLCQSIASRLPASAGINGGQLYLCGLLHNFGLLLLGHLFPHDFEQLNRLREESPEIPLAELEKRVFTRASSEATLPVGHASVGGILMKLWDMPEAVVQVAGMHEHRDYAGAEAVSVLSVQLANALLKPLGLGDEFDDDPPEAYLAALGLDESDLVVIREAIDGASAELDALAGILSS